MIRSSDDLAHAPCFSGSHAGLILRFTCGTFNLELRDHDVADCVHDKHKCRPHQGLHGEQVYNDHALLDCLLKCLPRHPPVLQHLLSALTILAHANDNVEASVAVVATELRVLGDREEAEEEQTTVTHSFRDWCLLSHILI